MKTYQQLTDHLKTIEKHEIHDSASQSYITFVHEFMDSLNEFCSKHQNAFDGQFYNILLENNISWDIKDMSNTDVTSLDEKVILVSLKMLNIFYQVNKVHQCYQTVNLLLC